MFWEGHKILRNLHLTFDCMYCSQKLGEDFVKFCGLLRIYELYQTHYSNENKMSHFSLIEGKWSSLGIKLGSPICQKSNINTIGTLVCEFEPNRSISIPNHLLSNLWDVFTNFLYSQAPNKRVYSFNYSMFCS